MLVVFPLLLGYCASIPAHPGMANAVSREGHDVNHPLVLVSDADFLTALIALYEESIEASLATRKSASSRKVRTYAAKTVTRYRGEITKFRALLARYGKDARPDFHFTSRMPDLHNLSGSAAEKYYLSGSSELLAAKIELAEFASGTVKSPEVKKLATAILEMKSSELTMLNRWLDGYRER